MNCRNGCGRHVLAVMMLLVGALLLVQGCSEKEPPAPAETKQPAPQMQAEQLAAEAENAAEEATVQVAAIEQTTCPVMDGNPINKDLFIEYQGKKVYFCCAGCEDKFKADPEKYMAKLPQFQK